MGELQNPPVDGVGDVDREDGGRIPMKAATTTAWKKAVRFADVVMSNQASTASKVAVAVAGNCTLGSTRKAM
jgi:hypothetical protein